MLLRMLTSMLVVMTFVLSAPSNASERFALVLSRGKYMLIESMPLRIVDFGTLSWPGLMRVDGLPIENSPENFLFIHQASFRPEDESGSIFQLHMDIVGGANVFNVVRKIKPPGDRGLFRGAKMLGDKLFVEWDTERSLVATVYDRSSSMDSPAKTIEGLPISAGSCLVNESVFSVRASNPIKVFEADLRTGNVRSDSIEKHLPQKLGVRLLVDARSCLALIGDVDTSTGREAYRARLTLVDIRDGSTVAQYDVNSRADYRILPATGTVLELQKKIVPNELPDGSTVGMRDEWTGHIRSMPIYDEAAWKELVLEPGSRLIGVSPGESTAYMLNANGVLVEISLNELKIDDTLRVPFSFAYLQFLGE